MRVVRISTPLAVALGGMLVLGTTLAASLTGCAGAAPPPAADPTSLETEAASPAPEEPRTTTLDLADAGVALTGDAGALAQAPAEGDDDDDGTEDDDMPSGNGSGVGAVRPRAKILELSDTELAARVKADVLALGSMSIGRTNSGALVNGVALPDSPYWERVSPELEWATTETRDYLSAALAQVHAKFPDSPKLFIGNVSTKNGGYFPPHVSHQSGRDVDIGYFLSKGHVWYAPANASNLDCPRTWAFVRALVTETDIEYIFMDRRVQALVRAYALSIGEDRAWVDSIFLGTPGLPPIVVHVRGHVTHLHARFRSPIAEELGRRAYPYLIRRGLVRATFSYAKHVAKKGETLSHLVLHFKVSREAIKKANNMSNDGLREGREYKIPQHGGVPTIPPVMIVARRLPPMTPPASIVPAVQPPPAVATVLNPVSAVLDSQRQATRAPTQGSFLTSPSSGGLNATLR